MGRLPDALAAYDEVIGRFPDDVFARTGRAEVLKEMGRLPDALAAYDEVIGRFPGNVVARNGRATVLLLLGRFAEARAVLPQVPASKNEWIGYYILCMSHVRQDELDEAMPRLDEAARAVPWALVKPAFQRALALALIRKREFDTAAELLREQAAHTQAAAHLQVGLLLLAHSNAELGRRTEALENLKQITGTEAQEIRMLKSALMTRYDFVIGARGPAAKPDWLPQEIEDREFKLVLFAA